MSIRSLRELLRGAAPGGKCILFSTHVMQEVAALCDTVVILGHGRVVASGSGVGIDEPHRPRFARGRTCQPAGLRRGPGRMSDAARILTVAGKEVLDTTSRSARPFWSRC